MTRRLEEPCLLTKISLLTVNLTYVILGVFEEIHGVVDQDSSTSEDPEVLKASLDQLDSMLRKHCEKSQALTIALQSGFCDTKFRLPFLRTTRLNVPKAFDNLVRFLDEKLRLFGPGALCRELRLDDLNATDLENLKSGYFSVLPVRDRAGRPMNIMMNSMAEPYSLESRVSSSADTTASIETEHAPVASSTS